MKSIIFTIALFTLFAVTAKAQIEQPVTIQTGRKIISGNELVVVIRATIQTGWHIYALDVPEGGPDKTIIKFEKSDQYTPIGQPASPKPKTVYMDAFKMNVGYFENSVTFQQRIKYKKGAKEVKGAINFEVCNDKHCLPPNDVYFNISI